MSAYPHGYMRKPTHMSIGGHARVAMRMDICIDMCADLCVEMCADLCVEMCADMCVDMCADM